MRRVNLIAIACILFILSVSSASAANQVLQYWMWDPEIKTMEQEMISKFEAAHPGVKVELTAISPKEYWTKLAAMAAAGKMPDVINMHPNSVEDFVSQKALLDLSAFIKRDFKPEDYFWSVLDSSFNLDGKYYGIPFAWVGTVLFYNKKLFDDAGLSYPKWGWTWDEFLKDAKALTKDKDGDGRIDTWGYMIFGRYAVADGWILQNDGEYLDRKNHRFVPNSNAVEAVQFLSDLVHVHKVAPKPKNYDLNKKKIKILFSKGQAAMITEGTWKIEYMRNINPIDDPWDLVPLPRGPHWKKDVMHAWADGMAISAQSKFPDKAWEFIKYMVNERPADLYYAGKVPFYKKEAFSHNWDDWKSKQLHPEHKTDILKFGENAAHFYTIFWKQWRGYGSAEESGVNALYDELFNGKITVDEFLKKSDRSVNRMLRRGYKK